MNITLIEVLLSGLSEQGIPCRFVENGLNIYLYCSPGGALARTDAPKENLS